MATQSFLKTVTLHGKKETKAFIRAVERSKDHEGKHFERYERQNANDMDKETIRSMFCKDAEARRMKCPTYKDITIKVKKTNNVVVGR